MIKRPIDSNKYKSFEHSVLILSYAGLLPLGILTLSLLMNWYNSAYMLNLLVSYGALILTFFREYTMGYCSFAIKKVSTSALPKNADLVRPRLLSMLRSLPAGNSSI